MPQDIPFFILAPHPPHAILLTRAITSISIRCAKCIYLHRLATNIAHIRAAFAHVFTYARPSVNHAPNSSIPSHSPSLHHPILLCLSLPRSNIISLTIHSYGHTIYHHTYLSFAHPSPSCFSSAAFTVRPLAISSQACQPILCHSICFCSSWNHTPGRGCPQMQKFVMRLLFLRH